MKPEVEAKFLDTDHDAVRAALNKIGATCQQPMRLMRRTIFDYPDHRLQKANWGRLRVRDEGNKITVAYKDDSLEQYSQEAETTVESYENMCAILEAIGLVAYSYQESKRETWIYNDVEIVLDEWPWLNPYIEIEAKTEPEIQDCAKKLGFKWQSAIFGSVDNVYRHQYPGMAKVETISSVGQIRFEANVPKWLTDRQTI